MPAGWRYFGMGSCPDCKDAYATLKVPVLQGHIVNNGDRDVLRGEHIPHFPPVCNSCLGNYTLDILCSCHRFPLRVADGRCKLCPK